jgi:hypothetical protein
VQSLLCWMVGGLYPSLWLPCGLLGFAGPTAVTVNVMCIAAACACGKQCLVFVCVLSGWLPNA